MSVRSSAVGVSFYFPLQICSCELIWDAIIASDASGFCFVLNRV